MGEWPWSILASFGDTFVVGESVETHISPPPPGKQDIPVRNTQKLGPVIQIAGMTTVHEPPTPGLFSLGLIGLGLAARQRQAR